MTIITVAMSITKRMTTPRAMVVPLSLVLDTVSSAIILNKRNQQ